MSALKQLLKQHDMTQSSLCKPLGVSTATVNLFINHGLSPKKRAAEFKAQFIELLKNKGIAPEEIQNALDADQSHANNDQALDGGTDSTTQPEEEQLMLLRKQTLTPEAKENLSYLKISLLKKFVMQQNFIRIQTSIMHVKQFGKLSKATVHSLH